MHFSIPETKELKEPNGSQTYIAYSIYINGILHSSMRYSQLYTLHDQLKQVYGSHALPFFPPKRFFPLSETQLEERRFCLEKYLQTVGQNTELVNSAILRRFLLTAQQKSNTKWHNEDNITVWLLNGMQITVKADINDNSEDILQRVCETLRITNELIQYFSLYIQRMSNGGNNCLLYLLQDIDSPVVTLQNIPPQNRIVLRKSCWDPSYDMKLMSDRAALNLLYVQTVADVENRWILADTTVKEQLAELQSKGAKREYLEVSRSLKYYGYLRFDNCTCDYPEPGTEVTTFIGGKELVMISKLDEELQTEYYFKIVRIRSWKITQLTELNNQVQISIEYLLAKDKLQWITVITEFAFLISVCLQEIVNELMMKRNGDLTSKGPLKNGSAGIKLGSSNGSLSSFSSSHSVNALNQINTNRKKSSSSVNKFAEKFSIMNMSHSNKTPYTVSFLANDSFENIGDEDL